MCVLYVSAIKCYTLGMTHVCTVCISYKTVKLEFFTCKKETLVKYIWNQILLLNFCLQDLLLKVVIQITHLLIAESRNSNHTSTYC